MEKDSQSMQGGKDSKIILRQGVGRCLMTFGPEEAKKLFKISGGIEHVSEQTVLCKSELMRDHTALLLDLCSNKTLTKNFFFAVLRRLVSLFLNFL
jgi:hypothetical protein